MNRKKRNRIIMLIFLVVVLAIAFLFTMKSGDIKDAIRIYVLKYGFIGIIILTFILDILWQPIGPEVPISIAILFGLNPVFVFVFTLVGSYAASLLNYYLGESYMSKRLIGSIESGDRSKYRDIFKKYGKWGVFLAAIGPVPWVPFCWLAGSFKMKFRKFFAYGLLPRAGRILVVVLFVWYLQVFLI